MICIPPTIIKEAVNTSSEPATSWGTNRKNPERLGRECERQQHKRGGKPDHTAGGAGGARHAHEARPDAHAAGHAEDAARHIGQPVGQNPFADVIPIGPSPSGVVDTLASGNDADGAKRCDHARSKKRRHQARIAPEVAGS